MIRSSTNRVPKELLIFADEVRETIKERELMEISRVNAMRRIIQLARPNLIKLKNEKK